MVKYLLIALCIGLSGCVAQTPVPTIPTLNQSDPAQLRELNAEYRKLREANPELYRALDKLNDAVREVQP